MFTAAGEFAGHVLALTINVDFSAAGVTAGTSGLQFGDLTLCHFTAQPALNNMTVSDFLGASNTLLGGGTFVYNIATMSAITESLNLAFASGFPDGFAQEHLLDGPCP